MNAASTDVLSRVKISEIYQALGGPRPRGRRGPAFWRGGDGLNVSMDDKRGVWHDFKTDEGGGVLALVQRVRGGNRADALRCVAELAGVPLDNTPVSAEDRARWALKRRDLEITLPTARYWQRAAVCMAEELLASIKVALFDATVPQPAIGEVGDVESLLSALRRADGVALVSEFRWWLERYPGMTAALVRQARHRERVARRALLAYLRQSEPAEAKAAV